MHSNELDELYDEMCRLVGDLVFILHDHGVESKQVVIADALRTALAHQSPHRSKFVIKAMKAAAGILDS